MIGGEEGVINETSFETSYPTLAESSSQVVVTGNTDVGRNETVDDAASNYTLWQKNMFRDRFADRDVFRHYDAKQYWDEYEQRQNAMKPKTGLNLLHVLEGICLALLVHRAHTYLAYAGSSEIASLTATGAYGLAAIAGIGLGAGIYYSGAGEYIGTTQLGELIGEGLYNLTHDEPPEVPYRGVK